MVEVEDETTTTAEQAENVVIQTVREVDEDQPLLGEDVSSRKSRGQHNTGSGGSGMITLRWSDRYPNCPWVTDFTGKLVTTGPGGQISLRGSFKTTNGSEGLFCLNLV